MNRFVLVTYSSDKRYLESLLSESKNCFGNKVVSSGFQNKTDFFDYLENSNSIDKIQLVLLDIEAFNNSTLQFLSKVNQSIPNAVKLIISESSFLIEIQKQIKESDSFQYLNRAWSADDFKVAINNAKNYYSNLQILLKHKAEKLLISGDEVPKQSKVLSESELTKERLFSIIAHDLKGPFTAILGISEILTNDWAELDDSDKLDLLKALRSSSENTFTLLENLMEWLKVYEYNGRPNQKSFNVSELLESVIDLSEINASKKNINIENNIAKDIELFADKNMVAAVLRNLISNAVKHTPEGSSIRIWLMTENECHTICVEDNGDGVFEEYILDFFHKKPMLSKTNVDKFSGMGLLISKDFVERNNGKIWLESEKGEGSKFYFTVPR